MNVEYLSDSSIFRITLRAALPASLGRAISCGFSAVAAGVREWPRMREQIPPPARYWWRLFHSPELVASSNFLEMSRKKLKKTLQTPDFFYFFDCVMLCVMMRGVALWGATIRDPQNCAQNSNYRVRVPFCSTFFANSARAF